MGHINHSRSHMQEVNLEVQEGKNMLVYEN
jgi:hypothetical protein